MNHIMVVDITRDALGPLWDYLDERKIPYYYVWKREDQLKSSENSIIHVYLRCDKEMLTILKLNFPNIKIQ